jgi:CHAT domain
VTVFPQEEKSVQKSISKELARSGPDLHLIVQMVPSGNEFILQFYLYSLRGNNKYNFKSFGKARLLERPQEKVQELYAELSEMAKHDLSPDEQYGAEVRLNSIGKNLWQEIIPKELKDEYWKFCSHTRSLLITSDEPWIPWEIIKPYNDTKVEPFWCQKFAMSRWLSESANVEILQLGIALPVASSNTGSVHLKDEMDFLERLNELHKSMECRTPLHNYLDVLNWLENENFSIMHFACHGEFDETSPSKSPIILTDRSLEPSDINTKFGERRQRPLIFINACHTGRTGSSLTWLGGWPVCLVNVAQVGAFIGTMWEVNDQLAVQFAKSFYIALLRYKLPIAEAFRYAREEIRKAKPYNSTWLAYVLYADPDAMMLDS